MGNMQDLNWVEARSLCSPVAVFEKIKLQVEEDVRVRNASLGGSRTQFRFIANGGSFVVAMDAPGVVGRGVKFILTQTGIEVLDAKDKKLLEASLTLNDDGECRLKVDNLEREFWQFRKQALETLFFQEAFLAN
jgi:hypothetical protein